jgi:hypothetical protein
VGRKRDQRLEEKLTGQNAAPADSCALSRAAEWFTLDSTWTRPMLQPPHPPNPPNAEVSEVGEVGEVPPPLEHWEAEPEPFCSSAV